MRTTRSIEVPLVPSAGYTVEERADGDQCPSGFGQVRIVLEDVEGAVEHLHLDLDPGFFGAVCQPSGIVEKHFEIAHLNQQRRQAGQVAKQGRDAGSSRGSVAVVQPRHRREHAGVDHGIGVRPRAHAGAGGGEVGPRRKQHRTGRLRLALFPQREQAGEGKAAAGRVSGDDDPTGLDAPVAQAVVACHGVLYRRRIGMFRCEAVVDAEHRCPTGGGNATHELCVGVEGAHHVAAAVEVEHAAVVARAGRADVPCRDAAGIEVALRDVAWNRREGGHVLHALAHGVDVVGALGEAWRIAHGLDGGAHLFARHVVRS